MHAIEPYYRWRDHYVSEEDEHSPYFRMKYDEFKFRHKVYNYLIHPQWDEFGSNTLYLKIIYTDYKRKFVIIQLMGEWNDCLHNDIMFLKNRIIDHFLKKGIIKFLLLCEYVYNFHASDDCYYEEWRSEVIEYGGWITLLNTSEHVMDEFDDHGLNNYIFYGEEFEEINWKPMPPPILIKLLDFLVKKQDKLLEY